MEGRDLILESARDLINLNGFDKVTVKMICDSAHISRKSFYVFYDDKFDVLNKIIYDDIIKEVKDLLARFMRVELNRSIILETMFEEIYKNRKFYSKLLKTDSTNSFEKLLINYFMDDYKAILTGAQIEDSEREYAIYFYSAAQTSLIKKWIMDDCILTPRQMAENYRKWAVTGLCKSYLPREKFCK